jgi:hypothetical protein
LVLFQRDKIIRMSFISISIAKIHRDQMRRFYAPLYKFDQREPQFGLAQGSHRLGLRLRVDGIG